MDLDRLKKLVEACHEEAEQTNDTIVSYAALVAYLLTVEPARTLKARLAECERERDEAGEAALLPIRRALLVRGFCGDGGLTTMVVRALEESQERGRTENREVLNALLEASDAFPPELEGTVAARVKLIVTERDTAIASAEAAKRERNAAVGARQFAEGQRDDLAVVLRGTNDAGVVHERGIIADAETNERERIAAWLETNSVPWPSANIGSAGIHQRKWIAAAIRQGAHRAQGG